MAASIHARRVFTQQRVVGEELDARRAVLMKELRRCIKSVDAKQQEDQIAGIHSADWLAELQGVIRGIGKAPDELDGTQGEVENRVAKATEISTSYAMEAVTISSKQLKDRGLIDQLDTVVDIGQIDQQLNEQDQDEADGDTQRSDAEVARDVDFRDDLEAAKDSARAERILAQQQIEVHRMQMRRHREEYNAALTHHLQGIDPEVPGWSPTWSREDFDINYLRRGMVISGNIQKAEQAFLRTLERARDLRLSPLPDKQHIFPDLPDDGASNLSRNAEGNGRTHPKVKAFCEDLPSTPPEPLSDGQAGHERPSSSPPLPTGLHPWESMSTRASPETRERIREVNPDEH